MNDYKILAKDWEVLNPKEEIFKQKEFFKKIIDQYSIRSCLDCACGTGWHLFMLDDLGIECFGSDLSPEMLGIARSNLEGRNICLKEVDFRFLANSWHQSFDMITCMSNAIRHMLDEREVITALKSMYERLNDNGILLIVNGFSDTLVNQKPKVLPGRIHSNQAFYFILEYPNDQEIVFNILNVKKTVDSFDHSFETIRLNAMKKVDFEKCLSETSFTKVNYFGDFDLRNFSAKESNRLIMIAEK